MAGNIFSIAEKLHYIIQGDIKIQAYYTQTLLANELDRCKEKGNTYTDDHIKEIQDTYWNKYQEVEQLKTSNMLWTKILRVG